MQDPAFSIWIPYIPHQLTALQVTAQAGHGQVLCSGVCTLVWSPDGCDKTQFLAVTALRSHVLAGCQWGMLQSLQATWDLNYICKVPSKQHVD